MVGRNIQREFEVAWPAFSAALAETIAWCTRPDRATDPEHALWSTELGDTTATGITKLGPIRENVWTPELDVEEAVARVRRLAAARRQLLVESRLPVPEADGSLHRGRLVAFDPTLTTFSGAAAMESGGFFDASGGAGWDAWVMAFDARSGPYRRGGGDLLILAWVPHDLQRIAAQGVLLNAVDCVWWPSRSADAQACLMSVLAGTAG